MLKTSQRSCSAWFAINFAVEAGSVRTSAGRFSALWDSLQKNGVALTSEKSAANSS